MQYHNMEVKTDICFYLHDHKSLNKLPTRQVFNSLSQLTFFTALALCRSLVMVKLSSTCSWQHVSVLHNTWLFLKACDELAASKEFYVRFASFSMFHKRFLRTLNRDDYVISYILLSSV